ncbi:MAG: hypothetical protein J6P20_10400 [Oscillospiraceae bacterium]|nr:hypothetical protein [Oscillospiraceae bacterium]
MSLKTYHDLKEMLCEELDEITRKGELTAGSLDTVDKLTHSIKSLEAIIAMNEASERGESGYYPHWMRSYENDRDTRRGRSYTQRRDSMGRYSRDNDRDGMIEELRELMQDAPDEHTRKRFQNFIRELENA